MKMCKILAMIFFYELIISIFSKYERKKRIRIQSMINYSIAKSPLSGINQTQERRMSFGGDTHITVARDLVAVADSYGPQALEALGKLIDALPAIGKTHNIKEFLLGINPEREAIANILHDNGIWTEVRHHLEELETAPKHTLIRRWLDGIVWHLEHPSIQKLFPPKLSKFERPEQIDRINAFFRQHGLE